MDTGTRQVATEQAVVDLRDEPAAAPTAGAARPTRRRVKAGPAPEATARAPEATTPAPAHAPKAEATTTATPRPLMRPAMREHHERLTPRSDCWWG